MLLSGDHARDRRVAARPGGTPYGRAPPRPRAPGPAARRRRAAAGRSRATPASCSPCSGPAGCRRQQDNPGVEIPALHETLDDVRGLARRATPCSSPARRAGWSAPCAAPARRGRGAWDIGRLMVAPDLHGRGLGRLLLEHDRGGGAGRRDDVRAVHRRRQPAQPADVQEGRLPAARRARARRGPDDQAARRPPDFRRAPRLWQTCPSAQSAKQDRPEDTSRRGPRPAPATGGAGAAGHARRWSAPIRIPEPRLTCGTREERP